MSDVMLGAEGRPQFIGTQKYDSNYPSYLRNFGIRHIQRQLLKILSSVLMVIIDVSFVFTKTFAFKIFSNTHLNNTCLVVLLCINFFLNY